MGTAATLLLLLPAEGTTTTGGIGTTSAPSCISAAARVKFSDQRISIGSVDDLMADQKRPEKKRKVSMRKAQRHLFKQQSVRTAIC
jgi:hypothetical protein